MAEVIMKTARILTPEEAEARKKRIQAILIEMLIEIESRESEEKSKQEDSPPDDGRRGTGRNR